MPATATFDVKIACEQKVSPGPLSEILMVPVGLKPPASVATPWMVPPDGAGAVTDKTVLAPWTMTAPFGSVHDVGPTTLLLASPL